MIKLIFLTVFTWTTPDVPADSLRMETINGKVFIIHRVSEKETLYSISRRYGTPITAILEFNANAAKGLEIGQLLQVLYVPKKTAASEGTIHKVAAKETLYSIAREYSVTAEELRTWNGLKDDHLSPGQELVVKKSATKATTEVKATGGIHVVEAQETLYSISKRYGVTIDQLKTWNSISGDAVKVGQTLNVVQPGTVLIADVAVKKDEVRANVPPEDVKQQSVDNSVRISENVHGTDEVKEGGLAELIEGTEGNRKYLALHRTAKTGAIIKVRNELNNREVFVRVVGPLPNTGINDNIVIKISKSAFDRLGAIDPKFRVEVTYYK